MKIVVTCGSPWSNLQAIDTFLQKGGMQSAKAAKKYSLETIQVWHQRVVAAYSDDVGDVSCPQPINPSKPWEQMATEIFAANADQACWGWSDANSTWFLDFWLNYDPHFRFVLIYTAPHKDFVKFINTVDAEYDINEFTQVWLSYNSELLKFYNRHPDRCVLLNYDACIDSPKVFGKLCGEKLNINFSEIAPKKIKSDDTSPLLELLALQILEPFQEVKALFAEMEATATGLKTISADGSQHELLLKATHEYQSLHKQSQQLVNTQQEVFKLAKDNTDLADCLADLEREREQLSQTQQQLLEELSVAKALLQIEEQTCLALQGQIDQFKQENTQLTATKDDLESRIAVLESEREHITQTQHQLQQQLSNTQVQHQTLQKEIQQENELLLLQLHQVQEELERYFVETQSLTTAKTDLENQLAALNGQQEHLQQQLNEALAQNHAKEQHSHVLQVQFEQLVEHNNQLSAAKSNLENQIAILNGEREQLHHAQHQLQQQLSNTQAQHQTFQNEIQQENELLLLQLHQVQEELEYYFVETQSLTTAKTDLENQLATLNAQQEHLQQQLNEAQAQNHAKEQHSHALQVQFEQLVEHNNQLSAAKSNLENQIAILNGEREQLHQAQHQLQQQLNEAQAQNHAKEQHSHALQVQFEQLVEHNHQLNNAKSNLELQLAVLNDEREQLHQSQQRLQQQLTEAQVHQQSVQKEIQQENELLLLQLHQVQEELEHYFMECQSLQTRNQETVSRLQRLSARFPDYYDYSAINVCEIDIKTDRQAIKWNIDDFFQSNREIPKFTFKTIVDADNEAMGILFEKEEGHNNIASLLSWPLHINNQSDCYLPLHTKPGNESFNQLSKLAASDWAMLKPLFNVITNALEQENILPPDTRSKIDVAYWLDVITVLRQAYLDTFDVFRFDKVSLYKEQVNPDYEHLWFKFKNVRFGDRYWADFQFRLSAANVRPGAFTVYPKLEFPLSDDKTLPFEKWFIEIHDAIGERMELRFALSPPAIDIQIWNSFVERDQALIASILEQLPFILEMVEKQGNRISRSYDDWKKVANDMQDVFSLLINYRRISS